MFAVVALVTGGLWWGQDEESGGAVEAARPDPPAAAGPTSGGFRGTDPHGLRGRPELPGTADRPRATPKRPPPKATPEATPKGTPEAARKPAPKPTARPGSQPTGNAANPEPAGRSAAPLPRSRATRLAIAFLDVDAPITDLRLDREGHLPAPPDDDPNLVGWYADGPSPGEQGTAVAVGHLDTDTGPAVFAGLTELKRGRPVEIRRADGRTAVYTVDSVTSYEKDEFPNREVYGARGRPELRLITCGGDYDRRTGYSGNVVVFAHLVEIREAPTAPARH